MLGFLRHHQPTVEFDKEAHLHSHLVGWGEERTPTCVPLTFNSCF